MSFAAEMKDFLDASRSMSQTMANDEATAKSRDERYGIKRGEMPPSTFTPGTGGSVGETTAPAGDKTGGQQPGTLANRGGGTFLKQAYDYYRSKGLGHIQSAAIAGNLQMESAAIRRCSPACARAMVAGRSMRASGTTSA